MYQLALAALFIVTITAALPAYIEQPLGDTYTPYSGDGSTSAGWPAESAWGTRDDLWTVNLSSMQQSCGWNTWGADDSEDEIDSIKSAIEQVASTTLVDERFILVVMMQESEGCVRVPTTGNGVVNPGLMQSHNGVGTCQDVNPCHESEIVQMITDGTAGTTSGDGLEQVLTEAIAAIGGDTGSRSFYAAARLYNSGSADYTNLNDGLGSTACYTSDIANRLTGWTIAPGTCVT